MENTEVGQFLHIEMWTKFGATHQWKNWIKQNLAEKFSRLPSTQDSCLPKTHAHLWKKSGKLEFQKCFFFKFGNIYVIFVPKF